MEEQEGSDEGGREGRRMGGGVNNSAKRTKGPNSKKL